MTGENPERWYERNAVWGSATATMAVILTVSAFQASDLHWLLIVAWPFACIAVRSLFKSVYEDRGELGLATVFGSVLVGFALLYVGSHLKPDRSSVPSNEQARLEIKSVAAIPTSPYGSPELRVSFHNAGKIPATNVIHYYNLATSARRLASKEITDIQDRLLGFVKPGQSPIELYPGQQGDSFFTVPGNPGELRVIHLLSQDFKHVLDGSRLMYLLAVFSYRDRTMANNVFGISESCAYFERTFDEMHPCGRIGASLVKTEPSH